MRAEWTFPEMQRFCVKVVCKDDLGNKTIGAGTIIVDKSLFYVVTAGHCICYKEGDSYVPFDAKCISIIQYADSVEKAYQVRKCAACDYGDDDYAVLEIDKIDDGYDYANKIKRAKMVVPDETFLFVGYTKLASRGRLFVVSKVGDHCLHLKDVQIDGQQCSGEELSQGCSGAGIFLYRHSRYYMLGYLTDIRDQTAAYSDFLWKDEVVFDNVLTVDSRDDITIDMVLVWDELDKKEIEQEQIDRLRLENSEWMDNLNRKCSILFPNEVECKSKSFMNDYVRGEELVMCLKNMNPTFDDELQKLMGKACERKTKKMPTFYESSISAQQNYLGLGDYLIEMVKAKFPEDRDELDLASSYVDYQLAYRLLNCSLEFKKS